LIQEVSAKKFSVTITRRKSRIKHCWSNGSQR